MTTGDQIKSSATKMLCMPSIHHELAMRAPNRVRQFVAKVLKKVEHYRVDVVAGDAYTASYKHYKRQEYQELYISSVAAMFREMLREVNMNLPFESRLHIDNSTYNHFSQLRSTDHSD